MKEATYRVVRFSTVSGYRFAAMAWTETAIISTRDHLDYTAARAELDEACAAIGVKPRWFDGEYEATDGGLRSAG